jgi:3-methyl-2-oxobutanoate hydroxymethyltransferase
MQRFLKYTRFSTQSTFINPTINTTLKPRTKITIDTIKQLYNSKKPITMMTAHDYPSAYTLNESLIDIILVGDSLGMVALGYDSTMQVTLEEMMHHSRACARGAKHSFIVGDMPFGTYESSIQKACDNAIKFVKQGRVEAVKLEGFID